MSRGTHYTKLTLTAAFLVVRVDLEAGLLRAVCAVYARLMAGSRIFAAVAAVGGVGHVSVTKRTCVSQVNMSRSFCALFPVNVHGSIADADGGGPCRATGADVQRSSACLRCFDAADGGWSCVVTGANVGDSGARLALGCR
jgi:hypothetical protein